MSELIVSSRPELRRPVMVAAFHPELSGDARLHGQFLGAMVGLAVDR